MRIKALHITRFGKLSDFDMAFEEGIQLISAPNEWGKSTVAAFIKYLFYGTKYKKTMLEDERLRAAPPSGQQAGGHLIFTFGGQELRLERTGLGKEKVRLWDNITGLASNLALTGEPGETFFGLDCGSFERSVFIYQNTLVPGGNSELETRIRNLVSSGEEDVSVSLARKQLEDGIRFYQNLRGGGQLPGLREDKARLQRDYEETVGKAKRFVLRQAELRTIREECAVSEKKEALLISAVEQARSKLQQGLDTQLAEGERALRETEARLGSLGAVAPKEAIDSLRRGLERLGEAAARRRAQQEQLALLERQKAELCPPEPWETAGEKPPVFPWAALLLFLGAVGLGAALWGLLQQLWGALLGGALAVLGGAWFLLALGKNRSARRSRALQEEAFRRRREEALKAAEQAAAQIAAADCRLKDCAREGETQKALLLSELRGFGFGALEEEELPQAVSKLEERLWTRDALLQRQAEQREKLAALRRLQDAETGGASASHILQEREAELAALREKLGGLRQSAAAAQTALTYEQKEQREPSEILELLQETEERLKQGEQTLRALSLAEETLDAAYEEMRMLFAPRLGRLSDDYFQRLTGGVYEKLCANERFQELYAVENGLHREFALLSKGTKDCAILALRLAVSKLLTTGEAPPLILDDAFAYLDDDRLEKALIFLREFSLERQVLIFTCQSREEQIFRRLPLMEAAAEKAAAASTAQM